MLPRMRLATFVSWVSAAILVILTARAIIQYVKTKQTSSSGKAALHGLSQSLQGGHQTHDTGRHGAIRSKTKRDFRPARASLKRSQAKAPSLRLYVGVNSRGRSPGSTAHACRGTWGKSRYVSAMELFVSAPKPTRQSDNYTVYLGNSTCIQFIIYSRPVS